MTERRFSHSSSPDANPTLRSLSLSALGRRRRRLVLAAGAAGIGLLAAALAVLVPTWRMVARFDAQAFSQPSRLYARAPELAKGHALDLSALRRTLTEQGYHQAAGSMQVTVGRWRVAGDTLTVHLRSAPSPAGILPPRC